MRKEIEGRNHRIAGMTLLLVVFFISGCRSFPFFSEEESRKRQTIATEKAINESIPLQKLEETCRNLPYFRDRTPSVKAMSQKKDELFYYYQLNVSSKYVFDAVKTFMTENGWVFSSENDGIWEHQYNYENSTYSIQVTQGKFGTDDFATNCRLKRPQDLDKKSE